MDRYQDAMVFGGGGIVFGVVLGWSPAAAIALCALAVAAWGGYTAWRRKHEPDR